MTIKRVKSAALVMFKGMAMGAADIVPGVSGGTIAFISGIYERLLGALRSLTPKALWLLKRQGPAAFWRHVDGNFLCLLFGGVLLSIALLSHVIEHALAAYPLQLWGFFCGLIIASTVYLARSLQLLHAQSIVALAAGVLFALLIANVKPVQVPVNTFTIFASGAIAICAMILPGVSGSFLLLVMGMYPVIIGAVTAFNWVLLSAFFAGCVTGLLVFSHVLYWLLQRFRRITLGVLTGFLAGSLAVVWPWKRVLETQLNHHGEPVPVVQDNVWPWVYEAVSGQASQWPSVLIVAMVGGVLVLGLEALAHKGKSAQL